MTQTRSALLEDVMAITREAGALIMKIYRCDFEVRGKQDASPVTEADVKAERLILERLGTLQSQFPHFSEGSGMSAIRRSSARPEAVAMR